MDGSRGAPTQAAAPGTNIVQTALDAGRSIEHSQHTIRGTTIIDAKPFIILKDFEGNEKVEYLEQRFANPPRKNGTVKMSDEASFLEYWARHNNSDSTIYASLKPAQFLAVFDDHKKDQADYRGHRAIFTLDHSKEWKEWTARDKQKFEGNEAFAIWLENMVPDFVKPEGGKMMEIVLNFKVNNNAAFSNAVRLQDGNTELTFTDNVEASARVGSGKVRIPEEFEIEIPVFDGIEAPKYRVTARFRFRLQSGALTIWYELVRPHKVVETAFKKMLDSINKATKKSALFGSPE